MRDNGDRWTRGETGLDRGGGRGREIGFKAAEENVEIFRRNFKGRRRTDERSTLNNGENSRVPSG